MFDKDKSYQLKQERGETVEIAMPPLPEEPAQPAQPEPQLEETLQEMPELVHQHVAPPPESDSSRNLRALREKAERAERERDEMMRRLQEIEAQRQQVPEEADVDLRDDDVAEGRHLTKMGRKIKNLEEQLKHYQQKTVEVSAESRLKSQYPDFDRVVSRENIEQLRASYPELAETINSNPDLFTKAAAAYTMIKKLNIAPEDTFQNERAIVQKNAAKPRPLASISPQQADSPLSQVNAFANGLTDDLKKQLHREMVEAMKKN